MSSISVFFKNRNECPVIINNRVIGVRKKENAISEVSFSEFIEYLDIDNEGIVYKSNNYGIININNLSNQFIDNKVINDIKIHSIVGGG